MNVFSRRTLIRSGVAAAGGLVLAGTLTGCSSSSTPTADGSTTTTLPVTNGNEALERLMAGNTRYVEGVPLNQGRDTVDRADTAQGQSPFAVILSCSDSRVSPEVIFDEGVGDLFVVRVAGNTCETPIVQGTIEYAIEHLGSVLIMVLGHESCGAVKAALDSVAGSPPPAGQISAFVEPIIPAAEKVQNLPKEQQLSAAIAQNVSDQAAVLSVLEPILQPEIADGNVKLVGAEYMLESGKVQLLS